MSASGPLIPAARALARAVDTLTFHPPVRFVYNPLVYARAPAEAYLAAYASSPKRVVFVGMNPGPWGMAQTGVPFGEIRIARDWLGISGPVLAPQGGHPRLPIDGFDCRRSEVSGSRLWGLLRDHYGTPERLSADLLVANYCPLLFLDVDGRNLTPDKIARRDRAPLFEACDRFLRAVVETMRPQWLVGVGRFVESRLDALGPVPGATPRIASIPHPSPASPSANKDWAGQATRALVTQGVWEPSQAAGPQAVSIGSPR